MIPCKEVIVEEIGGGFSISLKAGWNLVSCPLKDNRTLGEIFPYMSGKAMFYYNCLWDVRSSSMQLLEGYGFWINVSQPMTAVFMGEPINTKIAIPSLSPGEFRLVGYNFLTDTPIESIADAYIFADFSNITIMSIPTIYGDDPYYCSGPCEHEKCVGNPPLETIIPGRGYWMYGCEI